MKSFTCDICYETKTYKERTILHCNHRFCSNCIDSWNNFTCPICRKNVIQENNFFRVNFILKRIENELYLCSYTVKHENNFFHLSSIYGKKIDLCHENFLSNNGKVVIVYEKISELKEYSSKFICLRQAHTPLESFTPIPISCSYDFVDIKDNKIYTINPETSTVTFKSDIETIDE